MFSIIAGLTTGTFILALSSVLFKKTLRHDPDEPSKIAWFVEVEKNRSVVINRGGRPLHVLRGDEDPVSNAKLLLPWYWYKLYVMKTIGYHVYFPYFCEPTTYDLPRYRVREEDGKKIYEVVKKGTEGYRSNHVRTEATTWYFEFKGAEIEKIPFTIKGSVQIKIIEGKEIDALYKTDSWNVLLDQALNSVIRAVVRRDLTLDMVIGGTSKDLWKKPRASTDPYAVAAKLIQERLEQYKIESEQLPEFGIGIMRVDIIDFEDELSNNERSTLRKAIFDKEEARGTELKGKAEAAAIRLRGSAEADAIRERGEATADAQSRLSEVHKDNPDMSEAIIRADALRAFANNNGGIIDAIAAAFINKESRK